MACPLHYVISAGSAVNERAPVF